MGYKTDKGTLSDGILERLHTGEPVFVLRAQDKSAPQTVIHWIARNGESLPAFKAADALELAAAMIRWQEDNPDKVKTPD